jgi:ABC-2 type transport system permease protein
VVLLFGSVLGMVWFAARIYRVGVLMYGKRATLPELLRWLRYS